MSAANLAPTFIATDASRYTLKKFIGGTELWLMKTRHGHLHSVEIGDESQEFRKKLIG